MSTRINDAAAAYRASRTTPDYDTLVDAATRTRTREVALPGFRGDGTLPAGIHDADLGSFLLHVGTNDHRRSLYAQTGARLLELQRRGVREVFVAGSGISAKANPGDVDALYHAADAKRFPIGERMRDWLAGTHWHAAERRHFAPQSAWRLERPTWLQYFSHYATSTEKRPVAVIRVLLDDARPQSVAGAAALARSA